MSEFDIGGGDAFREFADDLESMADDVADALDDAVEKTALQVERSAKQNAPVDTGNLRASLRSARAGPANYLVGTNVEYAPDVEFGTQPHVITPDDAEALRFEGADGDIVFAQRVEHPGTPAADTAAPAVSEHESDLSRNIRAAIADLADRQF